jgi:Ni/Fe-hydrogenase 1 B-type cytochrome subunit
MQLAAKPNFSGPEKGRIPEPLPHEQSGPSVVVYVWQYPLRLAHWGLVISICLLAFTGYYLHSPFIQGHARVPFLMGWFRFVHEGVGMAFIALFLLRFYLFFGGNHWEGWRQMLPIHAKQFKEAVETMKFYAYLRPASIHRVGHNAAAAGSYIAVYAMVLVEIVTGLVMFNLLRHSPVLAFLLGWIPRMMNIQNIRLIHFLMTFAFFAYGIVHVHLCLINAKIEKNGLMDSMLTGYKVIPVDDLNEEDRAAIAASQDSRGR